MSLRSLTAFFLVPLSYIFSKLDEGMTLNQATNIAKDNGFTEPDLVMICLVWMSRVSCLFLLVSSANELEDVEVD
ncbi:hypothetical protein O9993_07955 [Vibrio lentus]|nr:hypothetical protein [Vibrio lentus]